MSLGRALRRRAANNEEALMPLVEADEDPLGVMDLATHKLPVEQAPHAYEIFQRKQDGAIKILLQP
jgi:threonine dehydrogenase-like Zn-dependent dehydrogenase